MEVQFTSPRTILLCCCQMAVDAVQSGWSPVFIAMLKRQAGVHWRERCVHLLGSRSQAHVPQNEDEQFDLHQMCALMGKVEFCSRLASVTAAASYSATRIPHNPALHSAPNMSPSQKAERRQYLLNIIDQFRQCFAHDVETLSATETLQALMAMCEVSSMLAESATALFGMTTQSQSRMDYAACIPGMFFYHWEILRRLVDFVQDLNFTCHAAKQNRFPSYLVARFSLHMENVLKLFGVLLLVEAAHILDATVSAIKNVKGSRGKHVDCETILVDCSYATNDLLAVYMRLKAAFKVPLNNVSGNTAEKKQDPIAWQQFTAVVNNHGSRDAIHRLKTEPVRLVKHLISAFEFLTGKNGLRNKIYHINTQSLTCQYLKQCIKKGLDIIDVLSSRHEHIHLLNRLAAYCSSLSRAPAESNIAVVYQLDTSTPERPISFHHTLLQPRPNLFGRLLDCNRLVDFLASPGVVVLTGKSGIGKSALAAQVAHELRCRYPCQYRLLCSSPFLLAQCLHTIGQLRCVPPARQHQHCIPERTSSHTNRHDYDLVHVAHQHLIGTSSLLLVCDDVQTLDSLLDFVPFACLQRHAVICTLATDKISAGLRGHIDRVLSYELQPLSTPATLEFISSLCPHLCKSGTLSAQSIESPLWLFIEQQAKQCPITVQLLAQCLKRVDATAPLDTALCLFSEQQGLLHDILEEQGSSRFHRCVLAEVRGKMCKLSWQANAFLVMCSIIGQSGCSIPLSTLASIAEPIFNEQQIPVASDSNRRVWSSGKLLKAEALQMVLDDLKSARLLDYCCYTRSVSVPLLIQKAAIELTMLAYSEGGLPLVEIAHQTYVHVMNKLDNFVGSLLVPEVRPSANSHKELPHLFPVAESLLSTASSCLSSSERLRLTICLGRGIFTVHMDWKTAQHHYANAVETMSRCEVRASALGLVLGEYGLVELNAGDVLEGIEHLQHSLSIFEGIDAKSMRDPFGSRKLSFRSVINKVRWLLSMAQANHDIPNRKIIELVQQNRSLLGTMLGDGKEQGLTTAPMPLPGVATCCGEVDLDCAAAVYPEQFWRAMSIWLSGNFEEGIHQLLCTTIDSLLCQVSGAAPMRVCSMLLVTHELSSAIPKWDTFEFYTSICYDMMVDILASWINQSPPEPCLPKIPSNIAKQQSASDLFKDKWLNTWVEAVKAGMTKIVNCFRIISILLCNFSLRNVFVTGLKIICEECESFIVSSIRQLARLFRWHVLPTNTWAVLQSLLDQMKWRGYNLWQTYHLSQTRVSCCTDGVDKKEASTNSAYIWMVYYFEGFFLSYLYKASRPYTRAECEEEGEVVFENFLTAEMKNLGASVPDSGSQSEQRHDTEKKRFLYSYMPKSGKRIRRQIPPDIKEARRHSGVNEEARNGAGRVTGNDECSVKTSDGSGGLDTRASGAGPVEKCLASDCVLSCLDSCQCSYCTEMQTVGCGDDQLLDDMVCAVESAFAQNHVPVMRCSLKQLAVLSNVSSPDELMELALYHLNVFKEIGWEKSETLSLPWIS